MRKPMLTMLLRACATVVLSLGLTTSVMASEWIRQLGTPKDDHAHAVATDADGKVYVAGNSESGTRSGNEDAAWLTKLGPGGWVHWKRELHSSGVDIATGAAADCEGHIHVAGWTTGSLAGGGNGRGFPDAWLAKYEARERCSGSDNSTTGRVLSTIRLKT